MLNISKEQNNMPTPSRQTVANELNKLQSSGATEQQINDYIAKSGYTETDFNVSLNGSFEPLTVGAGKQAGVDYIKPTAAETAESDRYYQNLATSASVPSGNAPTISGSSGVTGTTRVTTVTETKTEAWQQSTGGGSTTTYSTPATDTPASLVYKQEAQNASNLQQAYALNPDSRFGKAALDRRLADGRITQEQYDDIKNSTPEERRAKSSEYYNQYEQARSKETAAQEGGQPAVVVKSEPNTSTYTVESNKTVTSEVTKVKGDVPGSSNITTQTVDGAEYQVVTNADGSQSYTPVDSEYGEEQSIDYNPDDGDILREPPGTEVDEFGGLDEAIAANENALQEPPQLSDEEVNDYFTQQQDEQFEDYDTTIEDGSDPGVDFFEQSRLEAEEAYNQSIDANNDFSGPQGTTNAEFNTRSQATQQDANNSLAKGDWRVRLSLAPGANYLYKADNAGILAPLQETGGVLFPYTPSITVNYAASYDATELTHSNYKVFQYKNSAVDNISIGCDFTAQDTKEARYILAVIHFFRSVTKMFYGRDENPQNGTPPPLVYLTGMGAFQFDRHPLAITSFNMSLPTDVDYIRAGAVNDNPGVSTSSEFFRNNTFNQSLNNLSQSLTKIGFGGVSPAPAFKTRPSGSTEATYVPTKINISISAVPINSRNDISNNFSLRNYATGQLLRGSKNRTGTGMW